MDISYNNSNASNHQHHEELVMVPIKDPNKVEQQRIFIIKLLKGILIFSWIAMLGTGIGFVILSRVALTEINLTGDKILSYQALLNQMNISLPEKYFHINSREIESTLTTHPLIYKAEVKKTIFGVLEVYIERSQPVVSILSSKNGGNIPSYFDNDGRCVQVGVAQGIVDVPIVSGVKLINPSIGIHLPSWMKPLMNDISIIKQESRDLFRKISEIYIQDEGEGYRVLQIYFSGLKSSFITDMNITSHSIEQLWILANKFSTNPQFDNFDYFDTREGIIIGKRGSIL